MADPPNWEVRIAFDTIAPTPPGTIGELTRALRDKPGVSTAVGSLTDRGTGISTGATVIIDATSPGEALDATIEAFHQVCATLGISLERLRQAEVQQTDADPRTLPVTLPQRRP